MVVGAVLVVVRVAMVGDACGVGGGCSAPHSYVPILLCMYLSLSLGSGGAPYSLLYLAYIKHAC